MRRVKVVTIAIAFMIVLIAFTAQPAAAATRAESLTTYISGRFDVERGGYSPPSDDVVRVDATYGAILALDSLEILNNRPPPVNLTDVLEALIDRQWTSNVAGNDLDKKRYGGISEYLLGPVSNAMTLMGIELLLMLKAQADYPDILTIDVNTTAILVFVNKTQTTSGGFCSTTGENPDIVSTYQALTIIQLLDEYDEELNAWDWLANETKTMEWIESCRVGDAFKLNPNSVTPGVTPTAAGIMAFATLPSQSMTTVPDLQAALAWIQARQVDEADLVEYIGGFEEGNATGDPNFTSTYYALKVLDMADALTPVNESAVINFIMNCQAKDGSFGQLPNLVEGNLVNSGRACEMLNLFGSAVSILGSTIDPNTPGGVVLDWRLFVVVGIIVVALVFAILGVRQD
ncbi:MAG: hypothetical protein JW779_12960 [Candidatus Thorarchaeota archaeon]|nr:hypothetical protein [Candidatus Thorarchaeota archaeon]